MSKRFSRLSSARQRGMTLVELLVAMVIGLVVTLAVTSAVTFGESTKRSTTAINDMGQSGAYAAYVLDRAIRSAGSGFAQSWELGGFGCKLYANRGTTVVLPRPASPALPKPFADLLKNLGSPSELRVAPVLIDAGQSEGGSDILVVMSGNASAGDVPRSIISFDISTNSLRLDNTVQLKKNDITLVSHASSGKCLLEQVTSTFNDSVGNELLTLGGTGAFLTNTSDASLAALAATGDASLSVLGNAAANNVQLQLFGVGADRTLSTYDMLQQDGTNTSKALADGVTEMHALYGIDTNKDGTFDEWVAPTGDYAIDKMMASPDKLRQVVAVRVGLLLRSALQERKIVSPAALTIFADAGEGKAKEVTLDEDAQQYRYRVIEFTIPLRNILLLPSIS